MPRPPLAARGPPGNKQHRFMCNRLFQRLVCICLAAFCGLLAGCEKEVPYGMIELCFERMSGNAKVAVEDLTSEWVEGDPVRVNGTSTKVVYIGGTPYLDSPAQDVNRAVYPASLTTDALTSDQVSLTLPPTYNYAVGNDGRQLLETPLAARSSGSEPMEFKHLTAALCFHVVNETDAPLIIDEITATSDRYQLCGQISVNLADIESVGPNASSDNRSVTMAFPNDFTLGASEDVYVMLPILPVGNDNHFTIRLKCHNSSGDSWKFERTQGGGASDEVDRSISRNELAYAALRLSTSGEAPLSSTPLFTSDGTNRYKIQTPKEFSLMVQAIKKGWSNYRNCTFTLTNNLDMKGFTINPIYGYSISDNGSINFNGKTISNLTIESELIGSNYQCGLFYYAIQGDVNGLTLDNLSLKHTGADGSKNLYMGAICSQIPNNLASSISCSTNIKISSVDITTTPSTLYFGAFFGFIPGKASTSIVKIDLSGSCVDVNADISSSEKLYVGSLIGYKANGTSPYFNQCSITGEINVQTSGTYTLGSYIGENKGGVWISNKGSTNNVTFTLNGSPVTVN